MGCRRLGRGALEGLQRREMVHPRGNPGANLNSISNRCHLFEVEFVQELTKESIHLPLGCLQGGFSCSVITTGSVSFGVPLPASDSECPS